MTEYVGCEQARELLDGLIDGELSLNEQLLVESHLRWCRTCALRVEDIRLIGESLRGGSTTRFAVEDESVSAIQDAVVTRVRAERAQSWAVRVRDTFSDMRLLWPAIGATAAVVLCVSAASSVLQATSVRHEQSLASVIRTLAYPAPIKPAEDGFFGIAIPRPYEDDAERTGGMLDAIPDEDVIYAFRAVLDRQGRVSYSEQLASGWTTREEKAVHDVHDRAVLDAVAQTRFAAARTALGQPVAFDMVWMIAKTTVVGPAVEMRAPPIAAPVVKDEPVVAEEPVVDTANPRSSSNPRWRFRRLSTA